MTVIRSIHKKGSMSEISNYRPVANLCSGSKIFEKTKLQRIKKNYNEIKHQNQIKRPKDLWSN